ncbi:MAG: methyltransferase domain-containing protein [Planctomycetota bacterium]|nr:MAG: methyltransferase domain-containing protein [Planctomycetota bacterium]
MEHITDHLRLLGDENRLRILHALAQEPLTVAELQEVLNLSQSSVSSHLGKLKRSGYLHDLAEGSAHRYRLRDDLATEAAACWQAVRPLSLEHAAVREDRLRLEALRSQRGSSWVERVAGHLHREYAPGRTWEALGHSFLAALDLGDCVDIGAGDGAMIELLLGSCTSLTCVDPSPAMVSAGNQRIQEHGWAGASYCTALAEDLPLKSKHYDSVLFLQSLQYMQNPQKALKQALRILKPGGLLLCLTLEAHRFSDSDRYGHRHQGFTCQQLRSWTSGCQFQRCFALAAENRPPRFTPLLLTARKDS